MAAADFAQQWADSGLVTQAQFVDGAGFAEVTPEYVESLTAPTEGFLCPLSANVYGIDFTAFKIRAVDEHSEQVLFEMRTEPGEVDCGVVDDSARSIRYHFGPGFLDFRTIGTTLELTIGGAAAEELPYDREALFQGPAAQELRLHAALRHAEFHEHLGGYLRHAGAQLGLEGGAHCLPLGDALGQLLLRRREACDAQQGGVQLQPVSRGEGRSPASPRGRGGLFGASGAACAICSA
eukprot:CAMPEP_0117544888 /NCGR_PEP_ID=MMETSP0784-20121206/45810_1 /TAXON_ID=39447 /ORGANISM="" /LENGTH=236 /DNA_ID=CAMNT_0005341715 /DNA_START=80 /DNA_END=785 /DNA_ORIENTATION=-